MELFDLESILESRERTRTKLASVRDSIDELDNLYLAIPEYHLDTLEEFIDSVGPGDEYNPIADLIINNYKGRETLDRGLITACLQLLKYSFGNDTRRYSDRAIATHSLEVTMNALALTGETATPFLVYSAILHDVLEDLPDLKHHHDVVDQMQKDFGRQHSTCLLWERRKVRKSERTEIERKVSLYLLDERDTLANIIGFLRSRSTDSAISQLEELIPFITKRPGEAYHVYVQRFKGAPTEYRMDFVKVKLVDRISNGRELPELCFEEQKPPDYKLRKVPKVLIKLYFRNWILLNETVPESMLNSEGYLQLDPDQKDVFDMRVRLARDTDKQITNILTYLGGNRTHEGLASTWDAAGILTASPRVVQQIAGVTYHVQRDALAYDMQGGFTKRTRQNLLRWRSGCRRFDNVIGMLTQEQDAYGTNQVDFKGIISVGAFDTYVSRMTALKVLAQTTMSQNFIGSYCSGRWKSTLPIMDGETMVSYLKI